MKFWVGSRTGARTVGGGFPAALFRLRGGVTVPPWPRFQFRARVKTEHGGISRISAFLAGLRPEGGYGTHRAGSAFSVKLGRRTW